MAEPNATPEIQDNGPQQINTPPYPGTTKIDSGQAFDVSGKVLGAVDDDGKAAAKPPAPPRPFDFGFAQAAKPAATAAQPAQPSGFDFGFKEPTGAGPGAARGTKWESYARLGNYFRVEPMEGEEKTGVLHSVHGFLSFPNALYHAFNDPATDLEKAEIQQKMNQMRAGQGMPAYSTLPAVPGEYVGAITNTYDTKPKAPTRTQVALHRLVDAPAEELDQKANRELETARDLWDSRHDWDTPVPIGGGVSIPLGHAIAMSHSLSGAADKVLSKVPMLGPLVNGIAEKFENGDVSGGLTDIALLKAAEHAHGKITGVEPAIPSRIFTDKGHELGKAVRGALDAAKETAAKLKEAVTPERDVSKLANKAKDDFMKAAPPSKVAPYDDNDYETVRRTAEEGHKADQLKGGEGISGIETARDIVEDGRQAIENKRSSAVKKFANKPITTNVYQDVANSLEEADKTTPGFRDEGMKILEKHNFKDLTNEEADGIRKKLVADNRAIQKQNSWDVATARQTSPEFAAKDAAINSLRNGIYGSLTDAGVPEAYDWARDEAAHIRVRTALDRQMFNTEKSVRGTKAPGFLREKAAKGAKLAGGAAGFAIGSAAGPIGEAIGSALGYGAGEMIGEKIAPPDLTRDELMARSFKPENLATPAGSTVPASQEPAVQFPQGPAGPDLPPPPQPIPPVMPPPDSALHAALATRVGTTVARSNFENLMSKFQEYLDNTPTEKLTEGDRNLLQQLNESQANHHNKIAESVQKAVDQHKAAREKWQKEVEKTQDKFDAEQEKLKQSNIDAVENGERPTDENPHLASLGRGDESGLVSHTIARKAHAPAAEISGLGAGLTSQDAHIHELAHLAMDAVDGEPTGIEIRSDNHPATSKGAGASTSFNTESIIGEDGLVNPEKLKLELDKRISQKMAGPASHEVFGGMTKEEAMNHSATRSDVRQARAAVRMVEPDWPDSKVNEYLDGAYERARNFLTQPHIADRIKANAAVREEGLPDTLHASRERVSKFQQDILEAHNEHQGTTDSGPNSGGAGKGIEKNAQPATEEGKKNAGGSEGGRGQIVRGGNGENKATDRVAESQVSKPVKGLTERTTGSPETDEAIKAGGGIPGGVLGHLDEDHVKMFHDPQTGTTLGFRAKEPVTAEAVKAKLEASRAQYAAADLKKSLEESHVSTAGDEIPKGSFTQIDKQISGEEPKATEPFWHGSPSGDMRGGKLGLHIGTKQAATDALEARIGVPASGEWDGTKEYGKTLLAGKKTLEKSSKAGAGYHTPTGHNVAAPEEDYYAKGDATYGDGTKIPLNVKPDVFPVKIKGPMKNSPNTPKTDWDANSRMKGQLTRGNAKTGYYYTNASEDEGSVSAVVPRQEHVERLNAAAGLPKEDFSGVHYSNVPAENGVLKGATRGAAKAGSEQARVALGAEPGVYAYREGARPEEQIASRANKYSIKGQKAIADISGAQGDLFHKAYRAGQQAALEAGDNDTTAFHKGLNAAETAVKNAGYDGYEDKESYPGNTFLFGDQKIMPSDLEKSNIAKDAAQGADEYNKEEGRGAVDATMKPHSPEFAKRVADAFDAMKHDPANPEVQKAYGAMANEVKKQWDYAAQKMGMKFEPWTKEGQPYANSKEMMKDVADNKHLYFFQGGDIKADSLMAQVDPKTGLTYNDKFRAVHDLFGHAATGFEFGPKGEENAYLAHRQMFPSEAIPALTSETRGQNSWVNFGKHLRDAGGNVPKKGEAGYVAPTERPYSEQKAGLLPEEFHTATPGEQHWSEKVASNLEKQPAGGINPNNPEAPSKRYGFEILPEARQALETKPNAENFRDYAETHQKEIGSHPDIKLGWDTTGPKPELNVGAATDDLETAKQMARKLDQRALWDNQEEKTIDTGGKGVKTAFPEYPFEQRLKDLEQSNIAKGPKGSSVPLMDNPLPVKGTMMGGEVNTLDLTKALNQFSREKNPALEPGSEPKEMVARAKKLAEDEAKYQLAQSKTGTEWYTTEMRAHDKILQDLRPELTKGETTEGTNGHPVNLTLFKAAEAILSSGQKPYVNVKSALAAWDAYNETGEFPRSNPAPGKEGASWGPRGINSYGNAFDSLNKLIAEKGEKGTADWLLSEHPIKELRNYQSESQTPVKGKAADMETGAMILGAKRGPFMQNLHGIESKFTADMWVSRTWNRWMGTLDLDPRIEPRNKITSESDTPRNDAERGLMKESFEKTAGKLGLSTSSLQAVLWYYEQALYRAHGLPVESWSFSDAAKRVAGEKSAQEQQTGFNFGENEKKQGVMEGLGGQPTKTSGAISAFDFINALKKK